LGFRQLFIQLRNPLFGIVNLIRLPKGNAAPQRDILMELIVQRLLFLQQ
jgi:hypothetical protein